MVNLENKSILWRRLDQPGHEFCRLYFKNSNCNLRGTAIFSYNKLPCMLNYFIICNAKWKTLSAEVYGWIADNIINIGLLVDSNNIWRINGKECLDVEGCIDIDLAFSHLLMFFQFVEWI